MGTSDEGRGSRCPAGVARPRSCKRRSVACERTVGDETRASLSDARRERRARARTPDRTSKPLELRHIEPMFRWSCALGECATKRARTRAESYSRLLSREVVRLRLRFLRRRARRRRWVVVASGASSGPGPVSAPRELAGRWLTSENFAGRASSMPTPVDRGRACPRPRPTDQSPRVAERRPALGAYYASPLDVQERAHLLGAVDDLLAATSSRPRAAAAAASGRRSSCPCRAPRG